VNRSRLGNQVLWVTVAALAIGLPAYRWLEDREEERVRLAFEDAAGRAAIATVSDLPTARLISIQADRTGSACGWIELSPEIGAVPFRALAPVEETTDILGVWSRLDETEPVAWSQEVFSKQLNTLQCGRRHARGEQLPTPSNANRIPQVDQPVLALWDERGPVWAVIPALGVGYVALRRQVGGGATVSPVFSNSLSAELWTRSDGAALARSRDAQGAERMRQFEACVNRYERDDAARRTCFTPAEPAATS